MALKTLGATNVHSVREVRDKAGRALIKAHARRLVASTADPVRELANAALAIRDDRINS